jgi:predicted ArsR family transcriptional regulator
MFTHRQLLDTTRGRIVAALQRGALTADDIAAELGLTANAVRAQVTALERDGVVQRSGSRRGVTRPSHVFELTPEVEQLLSRAYVPLLTQLVRVFASALPAREANALLREAGKGLADELLLGAQPRGELDARVRAASRMLNEQLGAFTRVEKNGGYKIVGSGCPLSAVTGKHEAVCVAMESLVTRIVGAKAKQCCDRSARPQCCFEIAAAAKRK